ncbi:uncharacterized protein LOC111320689 isoform X2 [Stylophora pistillata]|uniref:uncharacterized protein LOC111320689 isoform X2 n=1 Tax=Stylophora pistillata TaxID=50429 RepID=UPI000C052ECE|nr:uncharacterized protein LOC111320689 isoform X2 [Stylophora pistillata]
MAGMQNQNVPNLQQVIQQQQAPIEAPPSGPVAPPAATIPQYPAHMWSGTGQSIQQGMNRPQPMLQSVSQSMQPSGKPDQPNTVEWYAKDHKQQLQQQEQMNHPNAMMPGGQQQYPKMSGGEQRMASVEFRRHLVVAAVLRKVGLALEGAITSLPAKSLSILKQHPKLMAEILKQEQQNKQQEMLQGMQNPMDPGMREASVGFSSPEPSIPNAAFFRALKLGVICDKRVKVAIIGPDRVGKTSLGKSLRGEPFDAEEPSTDGVQMSLPIKNAGTEPWRNLASQQNTTAFDHKCAEVIVKEELTTSTAQQECQSPSGAVEEELNDSAEQKVHMTQGEEAPEQAKVESTLGEDLIKSRSKEIAALMEDEGFESERVWPVIWDFAGQNIYHAIHPLFMSREAIYLLVVDLTKELSDLAQSFVKVGGHEEERAQSPESGNTNLDIFTRWLTLVHYLKQSGGNSTVGSVILVGTKADMVEGDPGEKMKSFVENISRTVPDFLLEHIAVPEDNFVVDNTKADTLSDEENTPIAKLRDFILKTAEDMPHTKEPIPLQWLSAELEIEEKVRHNVLYVSKETFKTDIVKKCCTQSEDDDVEGLLHFLHARGTIIYHTLPDSCNGLVILDPKWLIETICKIITTNPTWVYPLKYRRHYDCLRDTGILSNELLTFASEKLNITGIQNDLISVMKRFHLIFEWKNKHGDLIYLVPCMLTQISEVDLNTGSGPTPLCLRFYETGYVPCGFFPRLVVLFGVWASRKCSARQPNLSSNVASFFMGENFTVHLVRHSSVIKVSFSAEDASDHVQEKKFCRKILRCLKKCLKKLQKECLWLHAIPFKLYAKCELCPTSGKVPCIRHGKQECSHDDCAHYIDLEKKPLACERKPCRLPPHLKEKCIPWTEALDAFNLKEEPSTTSESQESSAKRKGTHPLGSKCKRSKDDIMTSETAEAAVKDGVPDEGVLDELAKEIPGEWKKLGRPLFKNHEATLKAIDVEEKQCREKAYGMLLKWKRAEGSHATYRVLYDALCGAERKDLAEKFCLSCHDFCAN